MDKKEAILKATLDIVSSQGLHATSMSMITEKANVGAGTIYRHFKNKEDLINFLYFSIKDKMEVAMQKGDNIKLGYKDRFHLFWTNLYAYFISNPKEFQFMEHYINSPNYKSISSGENSFYVPITEFLSEGIYKKLLRNMSIELMVSLVYGNIVSCAKLACEKKEMIEEELGDAINSSWDSIKFTVKQMSTF